MKKVWFILAILAIAAVALGLRLYRFVPPSTLEGYTVDPVSQLPPGLHSDEAYDAVAALRILNSGQLAPYSTIDQGRAVAHIYLTALVMVVAGPMPESSRIASVIASLLSVAAMAWAAREIFRTKFSAAELRVLQLIAAAQIAGTYWFVHFGRMGLDNIAVPWLMLPAFALLWRWLHQPSFKLSLLAGLSLGLVLYAYPAAYAVPIVVALTILAERLTQPEAFPPRAQLASYVTAFSLVALPLVVYAAQNPDQFIHRMQDTAAPSVGGLLDNLRLTAGGLFLQGDMLPFYNLPGRPLLDPIQGALTLIGGWLALRRFKQPEFLFVLLWCTIMLLPGILSAWSPAFNRMTGAVPGILLVTSLGGLQFYRWLSKLRWKWVAPATLAALVLVSFILTAHDYFVAWPNSKGLLTTFSLPERIQAQAVKAQAATQQLYLSPSDNQRSIFAYLWRDQPLAASFNGRRCTVIPRKLARDTSWVVNLMEDKRTLERLSALYPQVDSQPLWVNTGSTVVTQLFLPAGLTAQVPSTTLATVGDLFRLRDYRLIESPTRGGRLRARLLWEPIGTTTNDWTIATYLTDSSGAIVAQDDRQPCDGSYPTSRWQSGDLISDDRTLAVPADLPPGNYQLAIVFYRLSDNTRLPVRGSANQPLGDMLYLGTVTVP